MVLLIYERYIFQRNTALACLIWHTCTNFPLRCQSISSHKKLQPSLNLVISVFNTHELFSRAP